MNQLFVLVLYCKPKILSQDAAGFAVVMLNIQPFMGPTVLAGHFCGHVDALLCPGQSSSKHCATDVEFISDVLPDGQAAHVVQFAYLPSTQKQLTFSSVAPACDVLRNGHAVFLHALAPATSEYVPGGHKTHSLAPATEYAPAVQLRHTLAFVAPVTPEYVPAGQSAHGTLPLASLNLPATQVVQPPPFHVYPTLH